MNSTPTPPPAKKALSKLPPKNPVAAMPGQPWRDKVTQTADPNRVYTLNRGNTQRGKKIIIYGASGMGKTTVSAMAPASVFVSADDGADEILNPLTGEAIPRYSVRTYQDIRGVLGNPAHFKDFKTVVLDTMTQVEELSIPYILETVTKDGKTVRSIEGYGWGSGYAHIADHNTTVKNDLQRLADTGLNVIVLCQMAPRKETSGEVEEYLKDGPKLVWKPNVKAFSVTEFVEWSDFTFKIGYSNLTVSNKRATASGQRVIFTQPQPTFEAKARGEHWTRFPIISFDRPSDDSIWKFVFENAWKNVPEAEGSQ